MRTCPSCGFLLGPAWSSLSHTEPSWPPTSGSGSGWLCLYRGRETSQQASAMTIQVAISNNNTLEFGGTILFGQKKKKEKKKTVFFSFSFFKVVL